MTNEIIIQKPFLKWVGGKTQIINQIIDTIPKAMDNYHEIFLGGGSVLFAVLSLLQEEKVLLVHGSGFSAERGSGHVRLVHLADPDTLNEAFDRIERFLNNS